MPIDASIPLQVQQPASPIEQMAKAMTLKHLAAQAKLEPLQLQSAQLDVQAKQKAATDDEKITSVFQNAFDKTTGKLDRHKALDGLYGINPQLGEKLGTQWAQQDATFRKTLIDNHKAFTEAAFPLAKQVIDEYDGLVSSGIPGPVAERMVRPKITGAYNYLRAGGHGESLPEGGADKLTIDEIRTMANASPKGAELDMKERQFQQSERRLDQTDQRIAQTDSRLDQMAANQNKTTTQRDLEAAGVEPGTPEYKAMIKQKYGGEPLTQDAVDEVAKAALQDRTALMNLGRGTQGAATLSRVINKMAQNVKDNGDGRTISEIRAGFKADADSMKAMTKQYDAITAYEKTEKLNGDVLLQLVDKVDATGVPVIERWRRAGMKSVAGDPDVSAFNAQLRLYKTGAARIISNPNLTGVLTVEATKEIDKFLPEGASAEQVKRVVGLLNADMDRRKKGLESQLGGIKGRMSGTGGAAPAGPSAAPAQTNAKGWALHTDKAGNMAYVSPDGKDYEEVGAGK